MGGENQKGKARFGVLLDSIAPELQVPQINRSVFTALLPFSACGLGCFGAWMMLALFNPPALIQDTPWAYPLFCLALFACAAAANLVFYLLRETFRIRQLFVVVWTTVLAQDAIYCLCEAALGGGYSLQFFPVQRAALHALR